MGFGALTPNPYPLATYGLGRYVRLGEGHRMAKTARESVKPFRRYGDPKLYLFGHLAAKPEVGVAKWRYRRLELVDLYGWHKFRSRTARVTTPETASSLGAKGSTEIWRRLSSETVLSGSTSDDQVNTANSARKRHLPPNRKWKYGGSSTHELAAIDFLFDPNTLYGLSGHPLDAINYFRFRRDRKYWNLTSADLQNGRR